MMQSINRTHRPRLNCNKPWNMKPASTSSSLNLNRRSPGIKVSKPTRMKRISTEANYSCDALDNNISYHRRPETSQSKNTKTSTAIKLPILPSESKEKYSTDSIHN